MWPSSPEASNLVSGHLHHISNAIVCDRQNGSTPFTNITPADNGNSWEAQMCANGGIVIFTSDASDLVGDTNNASDVFRYNAATGEIVRVSIGANGMQGNGDSYDFGVSADGSSVAVHLDLDEFDLDANRRAARTVSPVS